MGKPVKLAVLLLTTSVLFCELEASAMSPVPQPDMGAANNDVGGSLYLHLCTSVMHASVTSTLLP
jgi:hypothetical protein